MQESKRGLEITTGGKKFISSDLEDQTLRKTLYRTLKEFKHTLT